MQRFLANDWDEGEERDTNDFLVLEKEIYDRMYGGGVGDSGGEDVENLNKRAEEHEMDMYQKSQGMVGDKTVGEQVELVLESEINDCAMEEEDENTPKQIVKI